MPKAYFASSQSNASHRVLDEINVPGAALPTMIQAALLKRLKQHLDSGNSIDHERLSEMLDQIPLLDPQTRDFVKNMAQVISPQKVNGKPGVPDDLNEIISQQIKRYETDRMRLNDGANSSPFAPSTLQTILQSNRSIADSIQANRLVDDPRFNELTRRFQEGSNRANQFTESRRQRFDSRRMTTPRSQSNAKVGGRSPGDGGLAKKMLESALEALDESSMDFLKDSKNRKRKAWNFAWLGKATKSLQSGAQQINRSLSGVTSVTNSNVPVPETETTIHDDGSVEATMLVILALGLVGFLLRRRFYQHKSPIDAPAPKRSHFSPSTVVDRNTFVQGVNRLATEMCDRDISYDHHEMIFSASGDFGKRAGELAPIYAKCRYAPGEYKLVSTELDRARSVLRNIHQSRLANEDGVT